MYGGIASHFELIAAEPAPSGKTGFNTFKIAPHDSCTITLAGILAFTGYVFIREPKFDAEQRGLRFIGRSLTADAVDSSALINGGQYKGYTFSAIASALAESVGVNFIIKGSSPNLALAFPQFSVAWGETVFQAIERLARMRGLHLTDDAKGNLIANVYNQEAASAGSLIEGSNLLEAGASIDGTNSAYYGADRINCDCIAARIYRRQRSTRSVPQGLSDVPVPI